MQNGEISVSIDKGISEVMFYHPAGNSFPSSLLDNLIGVLLKEDENKETKVVLIRSKGDRAFCAGASFDELLQIKDKEEGKAFFMGFARLINTIKNLNKPVLGMVQGKTVGGGVGLAASFDFCAASESAEIKLSELNIGIGPFVIAPVLEHKIGVSALASLTWDPNNWRSAKWALDKGLFHEVYKDMSELEKGIYKTASHLASLSSKALQEFKKASWDGTDNWLKLMEERAETSGTLVLGTEAREFLNTFTQKK
jgi:methylglutaconyl-CoA hydratase